jgi:hypothetical protein
MKPNESRLPTEGPVLPESEEIRQTKAKLHKLVRHISNVQKAAELLGEKLIDRGEIDLGVQLIANALAHDQGKFRGIEWQHLVTGTFDRPEVRLAARQHILTTAHHPEYWGGISQMPRVYVAEMVCDWYARSSEFGENIWEFVHTKAIPRYQIDVDSDRFAWIKDFLDLLLDRPFEESPT